MTSRRQYPTSSLAQRSTEIALLAPQVMAHRLLQFSAAGSKPSARDAAEFQRMWMEKFTAGQASWIAMLTQAWRMNLHFATSMWSTWWTLTPGRARARLSSHANRTAMAMLGAGLGPVHRKVRSNARRLTRTRL